MTMKKSLDKRFTEPSLGIIVFDNVDIITTSQENDPNQGEWDPQSSNELDLRKEE